MFKTIEELNARLESSPKLDTNSVMFSMLIENVPEDKVKKVKGFCEFWGRFMQADIEKGHALSEIAEKTAYEAGLEMVGPVVYDLAVGILSTCWVHGTDLRAWHSSKAQPSASA